MVRRVVVIFVIAAAMLAGVLVVAPRLHGPPAAESPPAGTVEEAPIASEAGMFRAIPGGPAVAHDAAVDPHGRTLASDARLRAFPGAPPRIPHPLEPEEFRRQQCNTCHQRGGWVGRFSAYAPVTPHPEYQNCLQCHVPTENVALFDGNAFEPAPRPRLGQASLAGAPPPIPHDLQLRGTCLSCHAGPSAPPEIRTTHPERVACRQCHVAIAGNETAVFMRPARATDGGTAP